jgi:hypothetical protein
MWNEWNARVFLNEFEKPSTAMDKVRVDTKTLVITSAKNLGAILREV